MQNNYNLMESAFADNTDMEKYCRHGDWRVRYAAAVAIGEAHNEKQLNLLHEMLLHEDTLPLYTQPAVLSFENSYDDTRMAEQLITTKAVFEKEHSEFELESWRCRGRVKQACIFAIAEIGSLTEGLTELLHIYMQKPHEDSTVRAAAARALGMAGHKGSIPYLEMGLKIDEWCVQTECKKAIERLKA